MLIAASLFLLTNLLGLYCSDFTLLYFITVSVLVLAGFSYLFIKSISNYKHYVWAIIIALIHLLYLVAIDKQLAWPEALSGKKLVLYGEVSSLITERVSGCQFVFLARALKDEALWYPIQPRKFLVNNYKKGFAEAPCHLQVGSELSFEGKIKRRHDVLNQFAFDKEANHFMHKISGYASLSHVLSEKPVTLFKPSFFQRLDYGIENGRGYFQKQFEKGYQFYLQTETQQSHKAFVLGLLNGILLGIHNMPVSDWQLFQKTGTSHLMAISGLHVGLLLGFLLFFFKGVRRYFLLSEGRQFCLIVCFIGGYALLAGFDFPVERASIMLLFFFLLRLLYRDIRFWDLYVLSLFVTLLFNPFAVLGTGFWLSYAAIGSILYLALQKKERHFLISICFFQARLSLLLLPVTLWFFQKIPLLSPLINLFAIPFFSLVLLPSAYFLMLSIWHHTTLQGIAWKAFYVLSIALQKALDYGCFSDKVILRHVLSLPEALSLFLGAALLLIPKGIPGRWLGVIFFLPLLANSQEKLANQEIVLTVFDVGEGLSVLIKTAHHQLLYDTGPSWPGGDRSSAWLPYLQRTTGNSLETVVISHRDRDHLGGLASLLRYFPTVSVLNNTQKPLLGQIPKTCRSPERWQWDGVRFEFLYPAEDLWQNGHFVGGKHNNASCVLKVTASNMRVLLPGDIEHFAEQYLLTHQQLALRSDVLIVPHHGSRTSSSLPFLYAVKPHYAVISSGYLNAYHFPSKLVLQRYKEIGAHTLNTATCAMIILRGLNPSAIDCLRERAPRLWRD